MSPYCHATNLINPSTGLPRCRSLTIILFGFTVNDVGDDVDDDDDDNDAAGAAGALYSDELVTNENVSPNDDRLAAVRLAGVGNDAGAGDDKMDDVAVVVGTACNGGISSSLLSVLIKRRSDELLHFSCL